MYGCANVARTAHLSGVVFNGKDRFLNCFALEKDMSKLKAVTIHGPKVVGECIRGVGAGIRFILFGPNVDPTDPISCGRGWEAIIKLDKGHRRFERTLRVFKKEWKGEPLTEETQ